MAQLNINLQQYDYQKTFEALPAGWYPAVITESEVVETAAKDGFRLKLTFTITDGPYKDRKIESGYNIQNKSQQAMDIAYSELKTIAACIGIFSTLADSQQMHNQPLQIRLAAKKDSDYNDVKGYKTIQGEDPGKAAQGAPVGHQVQPQQGFAQPPASVDPSASWQRTPDNAFKLNPATNAWEPNTPAPPPPAPPAPAAAAAAAAAPAAPAWATPVAPAAPAYPPPPPPAPASFQPPAPPAWAPNPAPPQAPSWGGPK